MSTYNYRAGPHIKYDGIQCIKIDCNHTCNMKCKGCQNTNENIEIDFDVFKKIIMQLKNYNIKEISIHNMSEPLIYSNFKKAILFIKEQLPDISIFITTNGYALDKSNMEFILKNIDCIKFSINYYDQYSSKNIMGIDIYDKIKNNIILLKEMRNNLDNSNCEIAGSTVIDVPYLKNSKLYKHNEIIQLLDSHRFNPYLKQGNTNLNGACGDPKFLNFNDFILTKSIPCKKAFIIPIIGMNGDVSFCNFNQSETIIGNIFKDNIYELYKNNKILNAHMINDVDVLKNSPCKWCLGL